MGKGKRKYRWIKVPNDLFKLSEQAVYPYQPQEFVVNALKEIVATYLYESEIDTLKAQMIIRDLFGKKDMRERLKYIKI